LLVVYARLDNKLSAFIVHNDDEGASFLDFPKVSGCQSATMGDVILKNALIPPFPAFRQNRRRQHDDSAGTGAGAGIYFAGICGVMDWQLDNVILFSANAKSTELTWVKIRPLVIKLLI